MRRNNYLNIKSSIKHINTPQGREELKNAQHPPEWIIAVPSVPHKPATLFVRQNNADQRNQIFQGRRIPDLAENEV